MPSPKGFDEGSYTDSSSSSSSDTFRKAKPAPPKIDFEELKAKMKAQVQAGWAAEQAASQRPPGSSGQGRKNPDSRRATQFSDRENMNVSATRYSQFSDMESTHHESRMRKGGDTSSVGRNEASRESSFVLSMGPPESSERASKEVRKSKPFGPHQSSTPFRRRGEEQESSGKSRGTPRKEPEKQGRGRRVPDRIPEEEEEAEVTLEESPQELSSIRPSVSESPSPPSPPPPEPSPKKTRQKKPEAPKKQAKKVTQKKLDFPKTRSRGNKPETEPSTSRAVDQPFSESDDDSPARRSPSPPQRRTSPRRRPQEPVEEPPSPPKKTTAPKPTRGRPKNTPQQRAAPSVREPSPQPAESSRSRTRAQPEEEEQPSTSRAQPARRGGRRHKLTPTKKPPATTANQRNLRMLKEMRRLQDMTTFLIPKLPFSRIVREITQAVTRSPDGLRYTPEALAAVQTAAEFYLTEVFTSANLVALHAKRVTVFPKDINLLRLLEVVKQ